MFCLSWFTALIVWQKLRWFSFFVLSADRQIVQFDLRQQSSIHFHTSWNCSYIFSGQERKTFKDAKSHHRFKEKNNQVEKKSHNSVEYQLIILIRKWMLFEKCNHREEKNQQTLVMNLIILDPFNIFRNRSTKFGNIGIRGFSKWWRKKSINWNIAFSFIRPLGCQENTVLTELFWNSSFSSWSLFCQILQFCVD